MDNEQSLQNTDESTGSIIFISDDDVETSHIQADEEEIHEDEIHEEEIHEEYRAVDADAGVPQAEDNDAK